MERFADVSDPCGMCVCREGTVTCEKRHCPQVTCRFPVQSDCCQSCNGVCDHMGRDYDSGSTFTPPNDPCSLCTCLNEVVSCQRKTCPQQCTHPLRYTDCCPVCEECLYGDVRYTHTQTVASPSDPCLRCVCGVSWTKEVTVYVRDVVVQLLQDWVVKVDHQTVTLPFLKEPYIYLERKSSTVLLNTNVGMKVLWNGRSHLELSVPGTYKEQMCGLCGNFNNYPQDDMRLRNGQITSSEATFGNSWKVAGVNSSSQCLDARNIDPCKEAGYSFKKLANARCAVLKSAMFEPCHRVVSPEMFFASSVGCPLERGYVFDECGPPCPKTCFNKDVPLGVIESHCFKPCVPGCQCPAGLVEHESHCVSPEKCPKIVHGAS
ncbi:Kielin/chordin-like protein [Bagarius yarrelli]|uniref:Kielin/chordin-like protein n=1 Tax=Bagarius yarrelli TaxID=175774 RepID=A0A556VKL2_BAGYA|nr:Kielin/chordin-like protein [Bagarius yarrelli]